MSTRKLVFLSLLISIGVVLNSVMPGIVFGMKPDLTLVMMFLGIILFTDLKTVGLLGIVTGLISALTTTFPGGQIPNILDKIITCFVIYLLIKVLNKTIASKVIDILVALIGTIVSGSVFLLTALLLVGLPAPFYVLFLTVVLPAAGLNTIAIIMFYPFLKKIKQNYKV